MHGTDRHPGRPDWGPAATRSGILLLILLLILTGSIHVVAGPAGKTVRWLDPDGSDLNLTPAQIEESLAQGTIVSVMPITGTAAHPVKVVLQHQGKRLKAVFRHVNEFRHQVQTNQGLRLNFRDSGLFECAAYRLDLLMNVGRVPPTVQRELKDSDFSEVRLIKALPSRKGSLQVWVDGTMTEGKRVEGGILPPIGRDWAYEYQVMWLFDNLIHNDDRNRGNMLIDSNWQIWLIDATRAFRPLRWLPFPERIRLCERGIWKKLQEVPDEAIRSATADFLSDSELENLIERRRLIVETLRAFIRHRGEKSVLFDRPGPLSRREEARSNP